MDDYIIGAYASRESFEYSFVGGNCEEGLIREQDRLLPIANVGRLMKQILPPNAKISKEAKETMQECVSEFISFVTGEASDRCHKEKRKTVNGDDICWALETLGFDDYADSLKRYLHKFRVFEGERVTSQNRMGDKDEDQEEYEQRPASSSYRYELPHMSDNINPNASNPATMSTYNYGRSIGSQLNNF
uniref:Transcription factor CBF/NF-Y/archaeal histone domain-containing protein n=1 Tax=Kalanchoe fedtschenkoi TaxID=63787 RepID=A0A7N0SZQ3_KALFE